MASSVSSEQTCGLNKLPVELIDLIARQVSSAYTDTAGDRDAKESQGRRDLIALSLINRRVRDVCFALVFGRINVTSYRLIGRGRLWDEDVTGVSLSPPSDKVLAACHTLWIGLNVIDLAIPVLLAAPIRTICIDCQAYEEDSLYQDDLLVLIARGLGRFPLLEALEFSDQPDHDMLRDIVEHLLPDLRLKSFSLARSATELGTLLSPARQVNRISLTDCAISIEQHYKPRSTLRHLSIDITPTPNYEDELEDMLRLLGGGLKSLSLSRFHFIPATEPRETRFAELTPELEILRLSHLTRPMANALLRHFQPSTSIVSIETQAVGPVPFPSPNKRLSGVCPDPAQLSSCLRNHHSFPNLKRLEVRFDAQEGEGETLDTMPLTEEGLKSLKAICTSREGLTYRLRMFRQGLVEMTEADFASQDAASEGPSTF